MASVFTTSISMNHTFCPLRAAFQSATPFQGIVQITANTRGRTKFLSIFSCPVKFRLETFNWGVIRNYLFSIIAHSSSSEKCLLKGFFYGPFQIFQAFPVMHGNSQDIFAYFFQFLKFFPN